jgi:predicted nuclease of predicted toxin-antitoxin system
VRFIVDAQLPKALSLWLNSKGYHSVHTSDLSKSNSTEDGEILKLAVEEERIIVTKDADFLEWFIIKSVPEKLLIVKTGNIPNRELLRIFDDHISTLIIMLERSRLVELRAEEIIEHEL